MKKFGEEMNEKPTVIQVINDLGRGGAETLLVGLLPELSREYNIVLVTLRDHMEFDESEIRSDYRYSLGYTSMKNLPAAIRRLKKIINKHKPSLVVSHLYWSTIIARLACPARIAMIFTVHQLLSDGAFNFNRKGALLRWIDKLTYRKRHVMIGVSQGVIDDYHKEVGLTGKSHVLHNYVDDIYFQNAIDYTFPSDGELNMVAVGNPKWEKNYEMLIRALSMLKRNDINCAIYGKSNYNPILEKLIEEQNSPVLLKGKSLKVYGELKKYDAFIMCSLSEGFGIAAAEAMAVGLPLFLSDLQVLREISGGNAIFFDPANEKDLAGKIADFKSGKYDTKAMSELGKEICKKNYTKKAYMEKMLKIYGETISN